MRRVLVLCFVLVMPAAAVAEEPVPVLRDEPLPQDGAAPAAAHANPRLQVSYRRFAVGGIGGADVPLAGGQLDVYPVSGRWVRFGLEAEGGAGDASVLGGNARLWYGLGGLTAGVQLPGRVTPFVEGRFAAGALGGSFTATATVGGTTGTVQGAAATLLFVGGVEAGVAVYAVGRTYVSVALGWAHPVFFGPNAAGLQGAAGLPSAGTSPVSQVAADVFTFKVGVGL
ncbi:MAG TPA: hypothetical protein VGQ83_33120 [Polyangia bacterium]|jgi:hypothetical protein